MWLRTHHTDGDVYSKNTLRMGLVLFVGLFPRGSSVVNAFCVPLQ